MHDSGKIKMINEFTQSESGNEPPPQKPLSDNWLPIPKSAVSEVVGYERKKRREWYRAYRKALFRGRNEEGAAIVAFERVRK